MKVPKTCVQADVQNLEIFGCSMLRKMQPLSFCNFVQATDFLVLFASEYGIIAIENSPEERNTDQRKL